MPRKKKQEPAPLPVTWSVQQLIDELLKLPDKTLPVYHGDLLEHTTTYLEVHHKVVDGDHEFVQIH